MRVAKTTRTFTTEYKVPVASYSRGDLTEQEIIDYEKSLTLEDLFGFDDDTIIKTDTVVEIVDEPDA